MKLLLFAVLYLGYQGILVNSQCVPSVTTVSGSHAPQGQICSGQMIFEDNFNDLDHGRWQHETTLAGGGNWEFQWYSNNRSNSYVYNGVLYLRPTITSDTTGEAFLTSGTLNIHGGAPADQCTNPSFWGCERTGTPTNVINPIRSARVRTVNSFAFRYGRIEVQARIPSGDWLWPAIWLMPKYNAYGTWPASGEIDLMESRGKHLIRSKDQRKSKVSGKRLLVSIFFNRNSITMYQMCTLSKDTGQKDTASTFLK
uniref:Uncharacterized protein n=1 Tax=Phlebotomus papatasi TaxID=29031 RepID=A0A1B0D530_PHLPP